MNQSKPEEDSHCIETKLKDILTVNSCTRLISELTKFILYRKRQLPYTFDRLKYLITEANSRRNEKTAPKTSALVESQFKIAEEGLANLELLFGKMEETLLVGYYVSEVALLFGSTPAMPKQVYRICLPPISFDHSSVNHPERKHLTHLLHSVIPSKNLCAMLSKPMPLTNMFVFVKINTIRENEINEWLIPRISFDIPQVGKHFFIKFHQADLTSCTCEVSDVRCFRGTTSWDYSEYYDVWCQASAVFKGFSDLYVDGVSVSDLWLR